VADALLKKLRPDVEVDSAGTNVSIPISEEAKRFLSRENAVEYLKATPEDLNRKRLDEYDLIVAMKDVHKKSILRHCPRCKKKIIVWNIEDPYFLPQGYTEKIFRQIQKKVMELANSL
jgi:protein-tyrosine-phosphatase